MLSPVGWQAGSSLAWGAACPCPHIISPGCHLKAHGANWGHPSGSWGRQKNTCLGKKKGISTDCLLGKGSPKGQPQGAALQSSMQNPLWDKRKACLLQERLPSALMGRDDPQGFYSGQNTRCDRRNRLGCRMVISKLTPTEK